MSMISLALVVSTKAFLPEIDAYKNYFENNGFNVDIVSCNESLGAYDVCLLFHGFHPFWRSYSKLIIGEYHSLSTGRARHFKDLFKRCFNVRADHYVFLNKYVRKKIFSSRQWSYTYRPMGYSPSLVDKYKHNNKRYDVSYVGSLRPGVLDRIYHLADMGLTLVVAGIRIDIDHPNIESFGAVDNEKAYELMSLSRIGLNFTPDIAPWNRQDSTKVIEYSALGLGVITNRYAWVDDFEVANQAKFLDLCSAQSKDDVLSFDYGVPDVSDLTWPNILNRSGLAKEIQYLSRSNVL